MSSVEIHQAQHTFGSQRPFTEFTRAGDYLWLSGQTAHDRVSGKLAGEGNLLEQARAAFQNIKDILQEAGCDLSAISKLTTYFAIPLSDEVARQYWEVRHEFFGDKPPASTGIQVAGLITPEVLIEIEALVYFPKAGA